jgi:hypothetical protein
MIDTESCAGLEALYLGLKLSGNQPAAEAIKEAAFHMQCRWAGAITGPGMPVGITGPPGGYSLPPMPDPLPGPHPDPSPLVEWVKDPLP